MSTDTPRTDAAAKAVGESGVDWHHSATVMRLHAIELERELEATLAANAQMRDALEEMLPMLESDEADSLECECANSEHGCERCSYFIKKQNIVHAALSSDSGKSYIRPRKFKEEIVKTWHEALAIGAARLPETRLAWECSRAKRVAGGNDL